MDAMAPRVVADDPTGAIIRPETKDRTSFHGLPASNRCLLRTVRQSRAGVCVGRPNRWIALPGKV